MDIYTEAPIIKRLPENLINQIAAGEVVDRPASVLKELLENSLDAGASKIEVNLSEGGKEEITVIDDGKGMHPDDLKLCAERHTTSKIQSESDLERIATFGFRGEALSSIASVSEMEIRSRQKKSPAAFSIAFQFGESQGELRPIGASPGTFVSIKNLFERVPARKKFLRSSATELSHCSKILKEVALGAPEVAFFLNHGGRRILELAPSDRKARVEAILRLEWEPTTVKEESETGSFEAFLSPSFLIQDRGELYFYLNGRAVRNRNLLSAVRRAYLDTLGPHHEPSGVCFLEMSFEWVDVNVHPQKWEVRLLKPEVLYQWISASIRKAISQKPSIMKIDEPEEVRVQSPVMEYKPSPQPIEIKKPAPKPVQEFFSYQKVGRTFDLKYIGQLRATYLLCEDKEGLLLVDQHALHEKFVFEKLCREAESGELKVQNLLVPAVISLPRDLEPIAREYQSVFQKLGIEYDSFGEHDISVRARPEILSEKETKETLLECFKWLRDEKGEAKDPLKAALRPVLATVACHSVVRANHRLTSLEAEKLLENITSIEMGWTCPHGRPVLYRLTTTAIEKYFGRIS